MPSRASARSVPCVCPLEAIPGAPYAEDCRDLLVEINVPWAVEYGRLEESLQARELAVGAMEAAYAGASSG
jgi:hypothetical protein